MCLIYITLFIALMVYIITCKQRKQLVLTRNEENMAKNYRKMIKDSGVKMYEVAHEAHTNASNLSVWLRYPEDLNNSQKERLENALQKLNIGSSN